ncbi:unnamed protein product [Trichogramma brassicae]|uniref:Uncharacterized protein n=1 Tax=Trichogramma brassicae TaxID=86971 RepID=A0A6H5I5C4_9HYME|nr:unnamed protein product [Trichogramma brassicae]
MRQMREKIWTQTSFALSQKNSPRGSQRLRIEFGPVGTPATHSCRARYTMYAANLSDHESGYKDEPVMCQDGKPSSRRTTPVHYAARQAGYDKNILDKLFEIYDRYDVNYTDESGLSHFHVACEYGCRDVVQKFLELGQDPNCIWRETGDSPLLLAAARDRKDVTELLLRHGADLNTANENGSTPLGVICKSRHGDDLTKILFEIADSKHHTVQVDVPDNLGRTPLQWAVAKLYNLS